MNKFISRLLKIGVKLELIGNYPWVYIDKINGNSVKEKYKSEHGFVLGYIGIKDNKFKFEDLSEVFKIIRKYK